MANNGIPKGKNHRCKRDTFIDSDGVPRRRHSIGRVVDSTGVPSRTKGTVVHAGRPRPGEPYRAIDVRSLGPGSHTIAWRDGSISRVVLEERLDSNGQPTGRCKVVNLPGAMPSSLRRKLYDTADQASAAYRARAAAEITRLSALVSPEAHAQAALMSQLRGHSVVGLLDRATGDFRKFALDEWSRYHVRPAVAQLVIRPDFMGGRTDREAIAQELANALMVRELKVQAQQFRYSIPWTSVDMAHRSGASADQINQVIQLYLPGPGGTDDLVSVRLPQVLDPTSPYPELSPSPWGQIDRHLRALALAGGDPASTAVTTGLAATGDREVLAELEVFARLVNPQATDYDIRALITKGRAGDLDDSMQRIFGPEIADLPNSFSRVANAATQLANASYAELDPRPNASNPVLDRPGVFGFEVTVPALADRLALNIDPQHGPNARTGAQSCAEASIGVVSRTGLRSATLCTIRPDVDAYAGMVLSVYSTPTDEGLNDRLADISRADQSRTGTWSPGPEGWNQPVSELAALSAQLADRTLPPSAKAARTAMYLLSGTTPTSTEAKVRIERDRSTAQLACTVSLTAQGRIAQVASEHRAATSVGYEQAPVVVATNPNMPNRDAAPYRKHTVARYNAASVDWDRETILSELNALEAARALELQLDTGIGVTATWGGQADIIGSPQGLDSLIEPDEVSAVVARHIRSTAADKSLDSAPATTQGPAASGGSASGATDGYVPSDTPAPDWYPDPSGAPDPSGGAAQ